MLVLSTGEKKKQIIKGKDNDMSDAQIEERMRELSYLKIHPRDKEENKLLLLRGERLYEESTGAILFTLFVVFQLFNALNSREPAKIAKAREELAQRLKDTELE